MTEKINELITVAEPRSAISEAYRTLRTNLDFASRNRAVKTLVITSAGVGEGKSTTLANLAVVSAQAGRKVILVDADLHRPRLHRVFNLTNNVGVTSALLADHPSVEGLLQETQIPGLRVLTAGPLPPNPAELLGSSRMKDLIAALNAHADMVILDTPPVVALADAAERGNDVAGATVYVTLEPCPMCAGALVQARVSRLVFGARDLKLGAAGSRYNLVSDETTHHRMDITDGILEGECAALLREFFEARRNGDKPSR